MRKLIGHKLFYTDKETNFSFYARLTPFYDLSIIAYNKQDQVVRQFMADFGTTIVTKYIDKEGMILIRSVSSKFVNSAVVASLKAYGEKQTPAIFLKRVAWTPTNRSVLGIDTLALPLPAVVEFTKYMKKLFKGVDLEYELEDTDGTHQDN
jgi:hypothetical protein